MTATVRNLLAAYETLDPAEKREILIEVLRRSPLTEPIPDEAFAELASDVFQSYEAEESSSGDR